jgi:glycosyltransferase involved in cell wall biosynthesis
MSFNPRPFVSVITPTYNRREFLPILIHLYQQQTYPAHLRELVIFDDSPTSNEDLIPKQDKSIRYIYQSIKVTLGEKRNMLNKMAKGDIIICFDDDDYHFPDRIAHSVMVLNRDKSLIAGTTVITVYYTDRKGLHQYGPFGNNHGTNGTFAFRKEYLKTHAHDGTKHAQEEPSFTNNFSEKMSQLDPYKTIICMDHTSNTFDKKRLLQQENKKFDKKLKDLIKDKVYIAFIKQIEEKAHNIRKEKNLKHEQITNDFNKLIETRDNSPLIISDEQFNLLLNNQLLLNSNLNLSNTQILTLVNTPDLKNPNLIEAQKMFRARFAQA